MTDKELSKWNKELFYIKRDTEKMKQIRQITKELLTNSGYHEKNMEEQMIKLANVNCKEDEKMILARVYDYNHKKARELWARLDKLISGEGF